MIILTKTNREIDVDKNSFYIEINEDGTKKLFFDISVYHEVYSDLFIEDRIEYEELLYLIKEKNEDEDIASIICTLDRDELRQDVYTDYKSESTTEISMMRNIINGTGWIVVGASNGLRKTLEIEDSDKLNALIEVSNLFGCYLDFDNKNRIISFEYPKSVNEKGLFVSEQVNLRKVGYNVDSYDLVTRIYGYGKTSEDTGEPLTFASINNGKEYIEDFSYKKEIISKIIRDDRFTDKESLLEYCKKQLEKYCFPTESFELDIINLAKINHQKYNMDEYRIRDIVDYVDLKSNRRVTHRIVKITEYPFCHEKDKIVLSNNPVTLEKLISSSLSNVEIIEKRSATFLQKAQEDAKRVIDAFSTMGHRYVTENETYYLDVLPKEKAKYIMRENLGGIAFSTNGLNGPYTTAWTIDGRFNAEFITSGTLRGIKIICESGYIGGLEVDGKILKFTAPSHVQLPSGPTKNGTMHFTINADGSMGSNIFTFDIIVDGTTYASGYLAPDQFYCENINGGSVATPYCSISDFLYAKSATIDSLNTSSLASKKSFIKKCKNIGLEEVMKTDVYSYRLKSENEKGAVNVPKHFGFIIGDEYNVSSEILGRDKDAIDLYSALAIAYKAIQEQQQQIDDLIGVLKAKGVIE